MTAPEVGLYSRASRRRNVVLPQPFSPSSTVLPPRRISQETSRNISLPPAEKQTFSEEKRGSPPAYSGQSSSIINDLVSDFSATSEELVASISNITQAIDGITSASNDSATGTTNIAQKTIVIVKGSEAVKNGAQTAEASAAELRKNVNNFVID